MIKYRTNFELFICSGNCVLHNSDDNNIYDKLNLFVVKCLFLVNLIFTLDFQFEYNDNDNKIIKFVITSPPFVRSHLYLFSFTDVHIQNYFVFICFPNSFIPIAYWL